jgi:hypothetical protein
VRPGGRSVRRFAAAALAATLAAPVSSGADLCTTVSPVFTGDPCDPATGPYPMMPGVSLVLPIKGPTGRWTDGPPAITSTLTGDVDLAVRVGSFPVATEVPAPAGSALNPVLLQNVAGGGGSSQGSAVAFTAFVTDGPGLTTYGAPLAGLHERPVAVFAYADLDNDGVIGPTDADGNIDNEFEKQEAVGHIGRQVGQIDVDRFRNLVAVRTAAPASLGGLRVALVAGMYTGDDPLQLWSNGTPIFTNWPFFPPLDPVAVVWLDEANPPDPSGPNILFYQPSEFLLPEPSEPGLVEAFALAADGSNGTTDQFLSLSGPAVGVRLFRNVSTTNFKASSRLGLRVAPATTGPGRRLVAPVGAIAVTTGQQAEVRLLPVDSLGNIADPLPAGIPVKIAVDGGLRISSPDLDGDPTTETISIDTAAGVLVQFDTTQASGRASVTLVDAPPAVPTGLDQVAVWTSASGGIDADDDGVGDDGDGSGTVGDHPCSAAEVLASTPCDDNCPNVVNPAQNDSDGDGQGNCCDGACVLDDSDAGCLECPQSASRFQSPIAIGRLKIQPRAGVKDDGVKLGAFVQLAEGQALAPEAEQVEFTIAEGNRLHWFAQLPGTFVASGGTKWSYDDPSGSLGGIFRARIRATMGGLRIRVAARGLNLVDTAPADPLPRGLVLGVTVGDDTFTRRLRCRSSLSVVRCTADDR